MFNVMQTQSSLGLFAALLIGVAGGGHWGWSSLFSFKDILRHFLKPKSLPEGEEKIDLIWSGCGGWVRERRTEWTAVATAAGCC